MDLNEKMANVRRATRLLAAYYQRVMTIVGLADHQLKRHAGPHPTPLTMNVWGPTDDKPIGNQTTNPVGRPGWDFLPLHDTWFRWTTGGVRTPQGPGSLVVYIHHITDDSFPNDRRVRLNPADPTQTGQPDSYLDVYAFALVSGTCGDSFPFIDGVFDQEAYRDDWYTNKVVDVPTDALKSASPDARIQYIGFRVRMADLATEDAVHARVLTPLTAALNAVVVPLP